jgi:hypothetical protein
MLLVYSKRVRLYEHKLVANFYELLLLVVSSFYEVLLLVVASFYEVLC